MKNQEQPKAWADDEYPEWLWGLLDSKKEDGGGEGSGSGSGGGVGGKGFGDAYCELILWNFFFRFWVSGDSSPRSESVLSYDLKK